MQMICPVTLRAAALRALAYGGQGTMTEVRERIADLARGKLVVNPFRALRGLVTEGLVVERALVYSLTRAGEREAEDVRVVLLGLADPGKRWEGAPGLTERAAKVWKGHAG